MAKKKVTIRLSLVFLITVLIVATAATLLFVTNRFNNNSKNWVLEVLSQKMSLYVIDKVTAGIIPDEEFSSAKKSIDKNDISPNSKIFLLDESYAVIASAEKKEGTLLSRSYRNKNMGDIDDPLVSKSFKKFLKNEKKKKRKLFKRKFDHFQFWHKGRKYISIYKPYSLNNGEKRFAAIVFPYRDFFTSMTRNNIWLYGLSGLFVLIAIFISMRISKRISYPLTLLAKETDKIRNFELDSEQHIESPLDEVEVMSNAIDNMRSGLRSFKKYVPSDLVKELIRLNKEATLGGEKKNLTVFFSDIAGFTSISEKLSPEVLVEFLGEYLGEMTEIILDNRGTVDKYIGDCVMAFWGAPEEFEDHALWACKSALLYQARLKELGKKWISEGKPDFNSRIGLNTGDIIVGNMGYEKRMNYTVIGDAVNLASRLEAQNKVYGTDIMLGEETYEVVKDFMETRFLDIVAVKGKEKGVKVYELICEKGDIDGPRAEHRAQYEKALNLYLKKDFSEAMKNFEEAYKMNADDIASKVFIGRCKSFIETPPPAGWEGVYVAKEK
ncbi:MAG: adenylate/guanylate cyclase domain-containing protein [bacterium]|nr:adenylate/guanylate cyclase domain-containing protein [bacterium]